MNKIENIVESVNFISEEDLLVQELDKRLSFDMLALDASEKGCAKCEDVCGCLVVGCACKTNHSTSCGVRG
jgi:hypothetical protein